MDHPTTPDTAPGAVPDNVYDLDAHRRARARARHPAGTGLFDPVGFATTRCRTYLRTCQETGVRPDPAILADYQGRGVDVAAILDETHP